MINFEPLADLICRLGESPVWDERRNAVFICDILGQDLYLISLDGALHQKWSFNEPVASLGLAESGRVVMALGRNIILFDPETGHTNLLARTPEPDTNRLNDGKVGPDGRFYVGSMDTRLQRDPIGSLYRISADGSVEQLIGGLQISNGLAWSHDGKRLYHSDSRGPWIDCYSFDPVQGTLSNRYRFADLNDATGKPDGGACDREDHYWCAGVTAGVLNRFSSNGVLVANYELPVRAPTMPCFCGNGLELLVITSLNEGLQSSPKAKLDGRVLIGRAPVAGVPVMRMRGV
jgi:sugar lactone lactonase YvrE